MRTALRAALWSRTAVVRRVAKLLVSRAYYYTGPLVSARLLSSRHAPAFATVIYYHNVKNEDRSRFRWQMEHLLAYTQPVRADHNAPLIRGKQYSAVTFDDGFRGVLENAIPELERLKIPATIFAIADRLGTTVPWERTDSCAAIDELKRLSGNYFIIGSHSLTHPLLTALDVTAAQDEIRESRIELERKLGLQIRLFCFPYGAHNERLARYCKEVGYQRVFTCVPRAAFSDPEEFVTGRVMIDPTDWPLEFHLKIVGAYRWISLLKRW
jgi:peptidoglycan/xylan/chitin deacetylase (PgdA/CDA1 family)